MSKSRIVGLLLILGVGFLVFRPGDESPDSSDRDGGSDSKSSTDRQFQPREPAFMPPGDDSSVARQPGAQETAPSYGGSIPYPRELNPQGYSSGYGDHGLYDGQAPIQRNAYRFRPLGEQEQTRMRMSYPDQYREPSYAGHPPQRQPVDPAPYSAPPPMRPDQQQQIYSFRPLEKSRTSRGRWQGPYQQPGWRDNRSPVDPWAAPPPQWGSTPPAQRMYPSYSRSTGRHITAR